MSWKIKVKEADGTIHEAGGNGTKTDWKKTTKSDKDSGQDEK